MTLKLAFFHSECQKAFELSKIKSDAKNRFQGNIVTEVKL